MYVKRSKYIGLVHFVLVISVLISGIGVFSVSALDSFPSATILDTFNRANGVIGTGWSGYTTAFSIAANQLDVTANGYDTYILWNNASFGASQEAYVTFSQVDPVAAEQSLLLKSQSSTSYGNGAIEILYDANADFVQVWTFHPTGGWAQYGANIPVVFVNGDQFGARALVNGTVEVYKNSTLLATRSITTWSLYASGGYIGVWMPNSSNALLDNFGGGAVSTAPTNTPTATFTSTPVFTPTNTLTSTPLFTPTNTPSFTPTDVLPTSTWTSTPPFTPTDTALPTQTLTSTATFTPTSVAPTFTSTNTPTITPLPTSTFTATNTPTPIATSAHSIFRVAANGTSSGSCGSNWSSPCNLQYALNSLASSGDELWVKQGVYTPGSARTSTFQLKNGVAVYGGFSGAETARNQRNADPTTNNTILSGDIGTVGAVADNVYNVVTVSGSLPNTYILDGFTITAGNSNGGVGHGGGVFIQDSSPTFTNLVISNNTASANGGGVYVVSIATTRANYSSPTFTNVLISNNTAARGGGFSVQFAC